MKQIHLRGVLNVYVMRNFNLQRVVRACWHPSLVEAKRARGDKCAAVLRLDALVPCGYGLPKKTVAKKPAL